MRSKGLSFVLERLKNIPAYDTLMDKNEELNN